MRFFAVLFLALLTITVVNDLSAWNTQPVAFNVLTIGQVICLGVFMLFPFIAKIPKRELLESLTLKAATNLFITLYVVKRVMVTWPKFDVFTVVYAAVVGMLLADLAMNVARRMKTPN